MRNERRCRPLILLGSRFRCVLRKFTQSRVLQPREADVLDRNVTSIGASEMASVHTATGHDGSAALTQIPRWGRRLCEALRRRSPGHSWVPVGSLRITAHSASSALCGAPHKAQFERSLIQERVQAGLAAARRRGRHGGRPTAIDAEKLVAVTAALDDGATNRLRKN